MKTFACTYNRERNEKSSDRLEKNMATMPRSSHNNKLIIIPWFLWKYGYRVYNSIKLLGRRSLVSSIFDSKNFTSEPILLFSADIFCMQHSGFLNMKSAIYTKSRNRSIFESKLFFQNVTKLSQNSTRIVRFHKTLHFDQFESSIFFSKKIFSHFRKMSD